MADGQTKRQRIRDSGYVSLEEAVRRLAELAEERDFSNANDLLKEYLPDDEAEKNNITPQTVVNWIA